MEEQVIKRKSKFLRIILINYVIIILLFIFLLPNLAKNEFKPKVLVQEKIKIAISNGANVEELDSILKAVSFTNNPLKMMTEIIIGKNDLDTNHYRGTTSLDRVLEDLINNNYLSNNFDYDFYLEVKGLLDESKKISSISLLPEEEANYFINIKNKIKEEEYLKIENDIKKLTDTLLQKNNSINIYLNQSEKSYVISWIALILTLFSFPMTVSQLFGFFKGVYDKYYKSKEKTLKLEEEQQ